MLKSLKAQDKEEEAVSTLVLIIAYRQTDNRETEPQPGGDELVFKETTGPPSYKGAEAASTALS